jgi:hypothetical protein
VVTTFQQNLWKHALQAAYSLNGSYIFRLLLVHGDMAQLL